ncbi:DUF1593 domain-containing protein [Puniceicoccaceae bacterium K14]|nr:DUF1593 domain-containing protein [Puniceicoccaceae bacterium K14]
MSYRKILVSVTKLVAVSLFSICGIGSLNGSSEKPRIIVTTDITNEPDDQESLVRLLTYSNEYDIEGLIGSTGIWKLMDPATEVIHDCIDAYAKVHDNLLLHSPDYPTAEYLRSITITGNRGYGMSAIGHRGMSSEGHRGSPGANLIIEAVDKDDSRPVWLLAWGGTNTIAQAIWTVRRTRSPEELEEFLGRIRVYDLAGQDDSGAWMANRFPDLFYIRNVLIYKGMSFKFSAKDTWDETRGGDESVVTRDWVSKNIQKKHGPLGKVYPDALHIWEGDTPTYFYLMPNGLNDPEKPWQGSWGGMFGREKQKNVNIVAQEYAGAPCSRGGCWVNEEPYLDYWMYADAEDKWEYGEGIYDNTWCSIFRWRTDFQNDFAARMDWCVKSYADANHNPVAVVNGDESKKVLYLEAKVGEAVTIDSSGSLDPDGDSMSYNWWVYERAGTYTGKVEVTEPNASSVCVRVPHDAVGKTIHVILTLRDSGTPQLTSYRRVVITGVR